MHIALHSIFTIFAPDMRRSLFSMIVMLIAALPVGAQEAAGNMKLASPDSVVNVVKTWNIDERYGRADTIPIDTAIVSYQDDTPVNRYSIANAWNGNLGSPLESKIYFDRTLKTFTMFSNAFDAYTIKPSDVTYYNTKVPLSNFTYRTSAVSYREEDYLKAMITMNANKHLNVGGLCNFIYGRGQYANQATRMLNGGFWTAYSGKRYEFNASIMFNDYKWLENGGISPDAYHYILDPGGSSINANNIPVNMQNAQSRYRNYNYFYNHKYSLGIEKERTLANDSVVKEFIPVTSFIHTLSFEDVRRVYYETGLAGGGYYPTNYYSDEYTKDSTSYWSLKNTFAVTLEEKYNTLLKFGLKAFVEYDIRHYGVGFDSIYLSENSYSHNLKVGGEISKNEGKYIKYNFNGSVYVVGPQTGEFDVNGNIKYDFKLWKEPFELSGGATLMHISPDHLHYMYKSNHFQWDNDLRNSWVTQFRARLTVPRRDISIGFNMENHSNFTYLNQQGMPTQYDGNLQVIAADAKVNLKLWKFHLDNQFVYQFTSNRDVLPLPDFALYSNFYFMDKFFKVLTTQIGVSVRYHTAYYANVYEPALGQFRRQDEMKVGNYPEMNVYINFHLKTVRFYVQYYNFNKGLFGGNNSFTMPGYPINPATFQFGLSWNFWK